MRKKSAMLLILIGIIVTTPSFAQEESKDQDVVLKADKNATPSNGLPAFYKELERYMKYPDPKGLQGKVFIEFVVREDGRLSDFKVIKGIDPAYDSAAINTMRAAAKTAWQPAELNGKKISQRLVIPIVFNTPRKK